MTSPTILVLRGGAIGDFICTLPALAALRERWPAGRIHLVGYDPVIRLARAGGVADTSASLDRSDIAGLFVADTPMSDFHRRMAASCDIALSYLHDPSGAVCRNLKRAGAGCVVHGSPLVDAGHAIDWLMRPLQALDIQVRPNVPAVLRMPPDRIQAAGRRLPSSAAVRPPILIHPGSGSREKNWPASRFGELARRIRDRTSANPVFLIGEADRDVESELTRTYADIPMVKPPDLVELAGILSAGEAYIGNDSGVTHLAAAVGLPTLALFGPSDPDRWAPRNPAVRILRADPAAGGLPGLSVETVWRDGYAGARGIEPRIAG